MGPIDVTEQIILFAKNREKVSYSVQFVKKPKVDLAHFSRFVVNKDDSPQEWQFKSVKHQVVENLLEQNVSNSREGIKILKKQYGDATDSLVIQESERFVVENADRVFETKTLQKPSPWLRELIQKSLESESIISAERDELDTILLYGGRQIYFLAKNIQNENGELSLVEPISTMWIDIDTNNLRHEGDVQFSNGKKPLRLIERIVKMSDKATGDFILDYFAGSGTTAHAVINLNREDDGNRKYILVETNEYFDSVTLPRVKKVIYSKDWKAGKPVSREGSSHLLKYFALESYEDAMNNLELNRKDELEEAKLEFSSEFQEDYLLNYSLEFETQGSPSLLNLDNFAAPFDYKMKIAINGVGETQETPVDLVETFNYLIGLYVEKMQQIDGFRVVRGTTRTGERYLILWRTTKELKLELADKRLNDFLEKQNFDFSKIDTLYINGDAAIPVGNVRTENAAWQIKMIEAEFLKRMFE